MSETLITRAAQMISFGCTPREVAEKFIKEGHSPEAAFLAAMAGKVYANNINEDIARPSNG